MTTANETAPVATVASAPARKPLTEFKGIKIGDVVEGSTVFKVGSLPKKNKETGEVIPNQFEDVYFLARVPLRQGGFHQFKVGKLHVARGSHSERQRSLSSMASGDNTGPLKCLRLWETANGRVEGEFSQRQPAEDAMKAFYNEVDADGVRIRKTVRALVINTPTTGFLATIMDTDADGHPQVGAGWNIWTHISNCKGGDAQINSYSAGESEVILEVIDCRDPDPTKDSEKDRPDLIVQGSFPDVEDEKRASADLIVKLTGVANGTPITGKAVQGLKDGYRIEVNVAGAPTFDVTTADRPGLQLGDEVRVEVTLIPGDPPSVSYGLKKHGRRPR